MGRISGSNFRQEDDPPARDLTPESLSHPRRSYDVFSPQAKNKSKSAKNEENRSMDKRYKS